MSTLYPALSMLLHVSAAWAMGWIVGYERYFHGRASGTQVYCLVCMASCALTQIAGYPSLWYGGHPDVVIPANPVVVISAILQGIGFLGAGIIVKSGTSVRGLTTAASIWSSSAIGILVGVDLVVLGLGLTGLFALSMALIPTIERNLPAHATLLATLRYAPDKRPQEETLVAFLTERQLRIVPESLSVSFDGTSFELHFAVFADSTRRTRTIARISRELTTIPDVSGFSIEQTSRA